MSSPRAVPVAQRDHQDFLCHQWGDGGGKHTSAPVLAKVQENSTKEARTGWPMSPHLPAVPSGWWARPAAAPPKQERRNAERAFNPNAIDGRALHRARLSALYDGGGRRPRWHP